MDDLNELYNEIIMEHGMNSYNKKKLDNKTHELLGHNPSCGDEITLQLFIEDNIIKDASFEGKACAISQASTSILIDNIKNKTISDAKKIIEVFIKMIKREEITKEEIELLNDAVALKNISNMPQRVKCALLSWNTLNNELSKEDI